MIRKLLYIVSFMIGLAYADFTDDLIDDAPDLPELKPQNKSVIEKLRDLDLNVFPTKQGMNTTYLRYYAGLSNTSVYDPFQIRAWIVNSTFTPELYFNRGFPNVPIIEGWDSFYKLESNKKAIVDSYTKLLQLIYCKVPSVWWKQYINNQTYGVDPIYPIFWWGIGENQLTKSLIVRETMNALGAMSFELSKTFLDEINTCFDLYVVNQLTAFSFAPRFIPNQRMSALFALAQYVYVFETKQNLREMVEASIYSSLDDNIMRDGGLLEASFNYNLGEMNAYRYLIRLLNLSDHGRLKLMENLSMIQTPQFTFPLVGNTKFNILVPIPMNLTKSYAMPYSGYFVQRNANKNYLFFYNGRSQRGHKSRGLLSIQVFVNNRPFIVSNGPSTYETYTTIPSPQFFFSEFSTLKLSTVIVDQKSQTWSMPEWIEAPETVVNSYFDSVENDDLEYVDGVYHFGYGLQPDIDMSVSHTRSIVFIKSESAWIVLDVMNSRTPKNYTQIWNFHPSLTPRNISLINNSIITPIYNLYHLNASNLTYQLLYNDTVRGYGMQNLHLVAWGFPRAQVPSVNIHVHFRRNHLWTLIANRTIPVVVFGNGTRTIFSYQISAQYGVQYKTHAILLNATHLFQNNRLIRQFVPPIHIYIKNNTWRPLNRAQPDPSFTPIRKLYRKTAENVDQVVGGLCYAYTTASGRTQDHFFFAEFQRTSTGISPNCASHSIEFPRNRSAQERIVYRGYIQIQEDGVYEFTSTGTVFILNPRQEYMRAHTALFLSRGFHSITIVIHYPTRQDKCNFQLNGQPFNAFFRDVECNWNPMTPAIIENMPRWTCLSGISTSPISRTLTGDIQCMSLDGIHCLRGRSDQECSRLIRTNPLTLNPLVCGVAHNRIYRITGYEQPSHWCARAHQRIL